MNGMSMEALFAFLGDETPQTEPLQSGIGKADRTDCIAKPYLVGRQAASPFPIRRVFPAIHRDLRLGSGRNAERGLCKCTFHAGSANDARRA